MGLRENIKNFLTDNPVSDFPKNNAVGLRLERENVHNNSSFLPLKNINQFLSAPKPALNQPTHEWLLTQLHEIIELCAESETEEYSDKLSREGPIWSCASHHFTLVKTKRQNMDHKRPTLLVRS